MISKFFLTGIWLSPLAVLLGYLTHNVLNARPAEPRPEAAPRPMEKPSPPARMFAGVPIGGGDEGGPSHGLVTGVGKKSITVAADERREEVYDANGIFKRVIVYPAQPPRTFTAIGPLAEGGFLKAGHPPHQYRLSDVKVGDKVSFYWRRVGQVYEINAVCIGRRPGGRVPPSPGEKPGEKNPWHERANALQDHEEKGIPLPAKYGGPREVAPPPREAGPTRIPPAK